VSIPKVSPTCAPVPIEEERGYLERAVYWMKYSVFHVARDDSETLFKQRLLEQLKTQVLCPTVLRRQFDRYVLKEQRYETFENLGKKNPLGVRDRFLNWIWRDDRAVRKHYREIGREMARQNPYLLAPSLEKALSEDPNRLDSTSCGTSSIPSSGSEKPKSENSKPDGRLPG